MDPRINIEKFPEDKINIDKLKVDKEASLELNEITGEGFEVLLKQLNQNHEIFCQKIENAQKLESRSSYYSTLVFQKKITHGLRQQLKLPPEVNPYEAIKESEKNEYESLKKLISDEYEKYKKILIQNKIEAENVNKIINDMRPTLKKLVSSIKDDVVQMLQQSAQEYREYLVKQKEWPSEIKYSSKNDSSKISESKINAFTEFTDIFGCVVTVESSEHPYLLNTDKGYGLTFGRLARQEEALPSVAPSIEKTKEYNLFQLTEMVNKVISASKANSNKKKILEILRNNLINLVNKFHEIFNIEEKKALSAENPLVLLKNDSDIIDDHIEKHKATLDEFTKQKNISLLKDLENSINNLKSYSEIENKKQANFINLIKKETSIAFNLLEGPAEKVYSQIGRRLANITTANSEARKNSLRQSAALNRLETFYQAAIRMAKQNDRKEFEIAAKGAADALVEAEAAMQISKNRLENIEQDQTLVVKQLQLVKKNYDASYHRIPAAAAEKEIKIFEEQKKTYLEGQREYNALRMLPKALQKYSDFLFHFAAIQKEAQQVNQFFKEVPNLVKLLWDDYHKALTSAPHNNENVRDLSNVSNNNLLHLNQIRGKISSILIVIQQNIKLMENRIKDLKKEFSENIHNRYELILSEAKMKCEDALKQAEITKNIIETVQKIPEAIVDYSSILKQNAFLREKLKAVKDLAENMQPKVNKLAAVCDEADKFTSSGVVSLRLKNIEAKEMKNATSDLEKTTSLLQECLDLKTTIQKGDGIKLEAKSDVKHNANLKSDNIRLPQTYRSLELAKLYYGQDLHAKPQQLFDEVEKFYSEVITTQNLAKEAYSSANNLSLQFQDKIKKTEEVAKKKERITKLRQLITDVILNNLDLWKVKKVGWWGGVNFNYNKQAYRIPHGIHAIISEIYKPKLTEREKNNFKILRKNAYKNQVPEIIETQTYKNWIRSVVEFAKKRCDMETSNLKYNFFHIREESTLQLYQALAKLDVSTTEEFSLQPFIDALSKIKGLKLLDHQLVDNLKNEDQYSDPSHFFDLKI